VSLWRRRRPPPQTDIRESDRVLASILRLAATTRANAEAVQARIASRAQEKDIRG
jgi:hypothetical protein